MNKEEKLLELRKRIPIFSCKPNCGECCGYHVAMSEMELYRIPQVAIILPDYICNNIAIWEYCMFQTQDGYCSIYEERPIRCRIYGCTDNPKSVYYCKYGCKPTQPWTEEEIQKLLKEYDELTEGQPEYITFGLIDGQMKPITRGING